MARSRLRVLLVAICGPAIALFACASDLPDESQIEVVGEEISGDPIKARTASTTTTSPSSTAPPTTSSEEVDELKGLDVSPCTSPIDEEWYVDVALDDPDGGLNMRVAPTLASEIIEVFPRSSAVLTMGTCATLGAFDWWKVANVQGSLEGWVSSRFLSELPVFNPGLGGAINDLENVGTSADSLDDLAAQLATAYGFDEDVVITTVVEPEAIDAVGGTTTYDLTGLKDDASNGYRLEIDFVFDKNESEEGELVSYTAIKITSYDLCSRGVTEEGICT